MIRSFDINSNMLSNKQSRLWLFETTWRSCDVPVILSHILHRHSIQIVFHANVSFLQAYSTQSILHRLMTTTISRLIHTHVQLIFILEQTHLRYTDVIMGVIVSQIVSLAIVYSTVYSDADQRKHQSSALLAFVWGIHRRPVNSPHKWLVTRKMFPFDDVIMLQRCICNYLLLYFLGSKSRLH